MTDVPTPEPPDARLPALPEEPTASTALTPASPSASLVQYAGASALATVAMTALVIGTAIPTTGILKYGSTFLLVAIAMRWAQDLDRDSEHPVVRWLARRSESLGNKFGVEFYGISALTAFAWAELSTMSIFSVPLARVLADPIGVAVGLFVEWIMESITNALSAILWWLDLFRAPGVDTRTAILIMVAGWAVWRVLDLKSPAPTPAGEGPEEE